MIGAIIGDIVGSRFEWDNCLSKDFELFAPECSVTDDSIMTLAIAKALMESLPDRSDLSVQAVRWMQLVGRPYRGCGYGGRFFDWMYSDDPKPYNSFGNGAAMRVSPCGFAARSLDEARRLARAVTEVTHNHPEGIKGAEATAVAIYLARTGSSMSDIRRAMAGYYDLDFTLNDIRDTYQFNETCQGTVPQALTAFFESTGFEDAIRNAISIGGDSDTLAAITGGIAEAYYGVPDALREQAMGYLDEFLAGILVEAERSI
ncbi:MAG: ADP-ribosylglycohydrolase family protein [Candidatus Fimadaptatus sp.]